MTASNATRNEIIEAWIANQLDDGECVWAGANLFVPRAGLYLAHLTNCPNLEIILSFYKHNFFNQKLPEFSEMFADGRLRYGSEMNMMSHSGEAFSHIRDIDVHFVGGLQVDSMGNTNLIGIEGEDSPFKIRGAGPGGGSSLSAESGRYYIYMTNHSPKTFVEECDYVSTVGPAKRDELGLPGGGPANVISPLGIMGFKNNRLCLEATMPGVDVEEVQRRTGFDLQTSATVTELDCVSQEQLRLLRDRINSEA